MPEWAEETSRWLKRPIVSSVKGLADCGNRKNLPKIFLWRIFCTFAQKYEYVEQTFVPVSGFFRSFGGVRFRAF